MDSAINKKKYIEEFFINKFKEAQKQSQKEPFYEAMELDLFMKIIPFVVNFIDKHLEYNDNINQTNIDSIVKSIVIEEWEKIKKGYPKDILERNVFDSIKAGMMITLDNIRKDA